VGVGSGNIKAIVTLLFFIFGSKVAMTNPIYNGYTKLSKFKKPTTIPFYVNLILLLLLILITYIIDYLKIKKLKKKVDDSDFVYLINRFKIPINSDQLLDNTKLKEKSKDFFTKLLFSIFLGIIIGLFYLCCGSMIGISGIFAIVGGNFLRDLGIHTNNWDSFNHTLARDYFNKNIFNSDIYIMIGAFIAASIRLNFGLEQCKNFIFYIKAVFGGFFMGLGAKMSYGCNIGAMTSGICSSSLYGYIWMIFCTLGVFASILLCTIIGIEDEKPKDEKPKDEELKEDEPIDEKKDKLTDDSQENSKIEVV
jgi:hypothetical protein